MLKPVKKVNDGTKGANPTNVVRDRPYMTAIDARKDVPPIKMRSRTSVPLPYLEVW